MTGVPKRHHFVPQVYLRAWADDRDLVAVRRRRGDSPFITGLKNAGLDNGLYGKGREASEREGAFSEAEGQWPELRAEIIATACRSLDTRQRVAEHITTQRLRTRQQRAQEDFIHTVAARHDSLFVEAPEMREFLVERWGIADPSPGEVQGACDFYNGAVNMNRRSKEFDTVMSLDVIRHTGEVEEALLQRHWQVRRCSEPLLITSDTPVVLVRPRSERDHVCGIGIMDAQEVWFPVDPRHLLVMSRTSGSRGLADVPSRSIVRANQEIAARCFEAVFTDPGRQEGLVSLRMSESKPAMRFNTGPLYERSWDGQDLLKGEVVHTWVPPHDEA